MIKKVFVWLLVLSLLCGCTGKAPAEEAPADSAAAGTEAAAQITEATVPADGDPENVTCKGSYTGQTDDAVVASVGKKNLTNSQLQVWYWAQVAQYTAQNHDKTPDLSKPLDTQKCSADETVASWQQYFLREALESWHSTQALLLQSEEVPMPTEEAYQPNLRNYEEYLTNIPATKYLYGYNVYYQNNTLHQEYLDTLAVKLESVAKEAGYANTAAMAQAAFGGSEEALTAFAKEYNQAYMYFTALAYYIEPTDEELESFCAEHQADGGTDAVADIRHILLVPDDILQEPTKNWSKTEATEPVVLEHVEVAEDGRVTCSEEAWAVCEQEAQELLEYWQKKTKATEATFAELANKHSEDTGTALDGGAYHKLRKGQMTQALDSWIFDPARQAGDTGIVRSDYGVHLLYFAGSQSLSRADAVEAYYRQQQTDILTKAKERYPMEVTYSAITLGQGEGSVSAGDILYPDIAHERFPEVPLYLQQDYPNTKYGAYKITTNGCGITSLAMLASYLADDELTPPEMCARYGRYSHSNGTDGMIFNYEPAVMGFYLREKTYDNRVAKAALEEGQIVISIQHPGYWTRGGHYIVCESITEDGLVQVRDSNIYNYGKIHGHKEDLHKWGNITAAGSGYWIYEDKITYIPACSRCGTGEAITESLLTQEYICHKCDTALLRRNSYLAG